VNRGISSLVDQSAQRAYEKFQEELESTKTFKKGVRALRDAPRTCGGFKEEKAILENLTPYEQTAALAQWIGEDGSSMQKSRTIALYNEKGVVPVWIKPPKNSHASLMTTILGHTTGTLKAPCYEDMAEEYLRGTLQERFIEPLNGLEMHRQPGCIGSLILKSSAFDANLIDEGYRYKVWDVKGVSLAKEASVELKGQNTSKVIKVKQQSAGFNIGRMVANNQYRRNNLLPELYYEDFSDEGYADDEHPFFNVKSIVKTLPKALRGDSEDLDALIEKLFAVRVQGSSIRSMRAKTRDVFFPENDA
jgi:hypothetical protein